VNWRWRKTLGDPRRGVATYGAISTRKLTRKKGLRGPMGNRSAQWPLLACRPAPLPSNRNDRDDVPAGSSSRDWAQWRSLCPSRRRSTFNTRWKIGSAGTKAKIERACEKVKRPPNPYPPRAVWVLISTFATFMRATGLEDPCRMRIPRLLACPRERRAVQEPDGDLRDLRKIGLFSTDAKMAQVEARTLSDSKPSRRVGRRTLLLIGGRSEAIGSPGRSATGWGGTFGM